MELDEIRSRIDELDRGLLPLVLKRMELSAAALESGALSPAEIKQRERELLKWAGEQQAGEMESYIHRFYTPVLSLIHI